jgi:voltage-gated potassium channel
MHFPFSLGLDKGGFTGARPAGNDEKVIEVWHNYNSVKIDHCWNNILMQCIKRVMREQLHRERNRLLRTIDRVIEGPMTMLGFIWLVLLVIELIWGLGRVLQAISMIIWVIFIIDFLLKFFLTTEKWHFLKHNWLMAISLIVPAFRMIRILRVFRFLRSVRLVKIIASLNRGMRSLSATMKRRGFGYVVTLTMLVTLGGAAGMYAIEKGHPGFQNYSMALWWTAMRVITAGSDFWPTTPEGRMLAFVLSLFGYGVFGYMTATLATFFIGRDAEDENAPVAGNDDVKELKQMIKRLSEQVNQGQTP